MIRDGPPIPAGQETYGVDQERSLDVKLNAKRSASPYVTELYRFKLELKTSFSV